MISALLGGGVHCAEQCGAQVPLYDTSDLTIPRHQPTDSLVSKKFFPASVLKTAVCYSNFGVETSGFSGVGGGFASYYPLGRSAPSNPPSAATRRFVIGFCWPSNIYIQSWVKIKERHYGLASDPCLLIKDHTFNMFKVISKLMFHCSFKRCIVMKF